MQIDMQVHYCSCTHQISLPPWRKSLQQFPSYSLGILHILFTKSRKVLCHKYNTRATNLHHLRSVIQQALHNLQSFCNFSERVLIWGSEYKSVSSKLTARVSSFNTIQTFILIQVHTALPVTRTDRSEHLLAAGVQGCKEAVLV